MSDWLGKVRASAGTCSLINRIDSDPQRQYHQAVAGGPSEWLSSLASLGLLQLRAQELEASESAHPLPRGGTAFIVAIEFPNCISTALPIGPSLYV